MKWRHALDVLSSIAVLAAAALLVWTLFAGRPPSGRNSASSAVILPSEPISMDGFGVVGNGPVGLIEFADFDCTYCRRFATDIWPILEIDYVTRGYLRFAFRHYPLASHPLGPRHATAAECAGEQGQFWEMHKSLFAAPLTADDSAYLLPSKSLRLDRTRFEKCLGRPSSRLQQDRTLGQALNIRGTPTFLLGRVNADGHLVVTKSLVGARPIADFRSILDDLVQR